MSDTTTPADERQPLMDEVQSASEAAFAAALEVRRLTDIRDAKLREAHGTRADGKLSYQELADLAGVSKGRIIQIVQPSR